MQFLLSEQDYIKENNLGLDLRGEIVPKIKEYIFLAISSVRKKLNQDNRKFCIEIFGFDFMIDANKKLWLIEVNTNPCLAESSPTLEQLIPRMIHDAFKLTIDPIFGYDYEKIKVRKLGLAPVIESEADRMNSTNTMTIGSAASNASLNIQQVDISEGVVDKIVEDEVIGVKTKPSRRAPEGEFSVDGYEDDFNMWECLGGGAASKQTIDQDFFFFHPN
eukprot:TRINITY_DN8619_c0_g1_i1.p2 TRINITY_DN8619_c0_g1~~TRINITY_DN8619_c0_g1_i1.p2  ORF type:complete len:219 (+),score=32.97 TRINITY_DN8619_c0_g1_i1:174-830(+)